MSMIRRTAAAALVVALAWRFADQMMAKHQTFLADGGKFVVPLPTFRVIEKTP